MKKKLLILGSNSSIAKDFIKLIEKEKYEKIFLFSRNIDKNYTDDIFSCHSVDFLDYENLTQMINKILNSNNNFELIFFYGKLNTNKDKHINSTIDLFQINAISQIYILENILNKNKNIIKTLLITSVAGDLIRDKNYIYSLSKNLLSNYINFLKNYKSINIIDLKIGPTITKMTEDEKKNFLFSNSYFVAKKIYYQLKNTNKGIVYIPFFWKYILLLLRQFPSSLIKIMKI